MSRFLRNLADHPIRTFAVLCVAAISIFLGYMAVWLTNTLASSDWCGKAIQAERISPGNTFLGLTSCIELLKIQLQATATNSHIVIGSFSLGLLALIVIVVAGGRLSGKLPGGAEFDMGKEPLPVKIEQPADRPVPVEPKP